MNEGLQELVWLGLSSYLDPEVGFRSEHKSNIRMVKNALEKPLGRIHKLSKPILRNAFLYGCLEFTREEKVEHLVVGFGKRYGGGTNIYKLLHIVGNETSVPVPPAFIRLIQAHALEDRSSETIVFHNHPADWFNAIHRMPLASTADRRLMVQKKFLEPFFLLKTVFGHGTMRFYVAERIRRRDAYFIAGGGSSPVGVLGYVDAGLELAMQVERKELPLPKVIYLAVGSSGTLGGLVLGLRLAGLNTRVVGIQVAPRIFANPRIALRLARKALKLMRRHDRSVPELALTQADMPMEAAYYGEGYGHPTEGGRRALALMARTEGIDLDLTYTAKTLSGLLHKVRSEGVKGPTLFLNTFNSVDLSPMANRVEPGLLPEEFHRFFQGKMVE